MARPRASGPTISSGRRGYLRYQYGSHFWIPETLANFSRGMVRDTAREAIPAGAVYDSSDFLLHQPGMAQKRGGTSYAGPALAGATTAQSVIHVPFASVVSQLIAVGSSGNAYNVTIGSSTNIGTLAYNSSLKPAVSPGGKFVLFPGGNGFSHDKYDGTTFSTTTTGARLNHMVAYKSRMVGSSAVSASEFNRSYFSPTPDVNSTWDTTNAWIDHDNAISGYAALNNALLVFSSDHIERIVGSTPPPNSDMDRQPLAPIGCTDARSIVTVGQFVYFANPQGVFLTNGSTPVSLTAQGGIDTYWRSLFSGYVPAAPLPSGATWIIAAGFWRGFLFVTVADNGFVNVTTLMCYVANRAWWRLTNIKSRSYTTAADGTNLWYADLSTNRVVAMGAILDPAAANKNDANGAAVTPTLEFAPIGSGPGVKNYGFGRLDFDMRDAASDNPVMNVTIKAGLEADTSSTPAESPLVETMTMARPRFQICLDAQAVTIALSQTNASSKTEIHALEVEQRPQSLVGDGVS